MILGENGEKMSKSRGNVVNPDDIVKDYGADTLRTYEMFIGAFDAAAAWSEDGVKGCRRFLDRVWKLQDMISEGEGYSDDLETKIHQTIKKVSGDFETLKYNTAIAAMMALINEFYKKGTLTKADFRTLLVLLNPVAPHITEELWEGMGGSIRRHGRNMTRQRLSRRYRRSACRSMERCARQQHWRWTFLRKRHWRQGRKLWQIRSQAERS